MQRYAPASRHCARRFIPNPGAAAPFPRSLLEGCPRDDSGAASGARAVVKASGGIMTGVEGNLYGAPGSVTTMYSTRASIVYSSSTQRSTLESFAAALTSFSSPPKYGLGPRSSCPGGSAFAYYGAWSLLFLFHVLRGHMGPLYKAPPDLPCRRGDSEREGEYTVAPLTGPLFISEKAFSAS